MIRIITVTACEQTATSVPNLSPFSQERLEWGRKRVETSTNYSADSASEACILSSLLSYGHGVCIPQT